MKDDSTKTKGQRTQEHIIEMALKLYGKHGFANTSMQMIANECELSQGAVMQHFTSKARLLEAVRKQVTASNHRFVDSKILPTDDSLAAIRKHILYNLDWALRYPAEANVIILTYETAIHDGESRGVSSGAIRLGTERLYRFVLAAQREKLADSKLDPELTAEILHTYLCGLIVRTMAQERPAKLSKKLESNVAAFIASMFT
ncbi:MAG: TetR family transcriptional regulator [Proteobacteria bacterium]|nr:MAG: TetR family transcriptional regulator [Pseudomonadota bacterium]